MTATHESLVEIAETIPTDRLKQIQRYQRTQLMLAHRNSDRGMAHFLQLRVDAAAEVLKSRRAA
jgi:hypothetical protein